MPTITLTTDECMYLLKIIDEEIKELDEEIRKPPAWVQILIDRRSSLVSAKEKIEKEHFR